MDAETRRQLESTRIAARATQRSVRILSQELAKLTEILDAQPERKAQRNGNEQERVRA